MKFWTILLTSFVLASAIGCAGDAMDADAKRAQDRIAIQLSEAQQQRDQYKSQVEKLQAQLDDIRKNADDSSAQLTLLRKQVQDLQNANTQLSSQNEKLKVDLSRANASKGGGESKPAQ